ncbi:MAG TPA: hypothetical protein V6D48_24445 [Oculatellaceae cyanobacterium]
MIVQKLQDLRLQRQRSLYLVLVANLEYYLIAPGTSSPLKKGFGKFDIN